MKTVIERTTGIIKPGWRELSELLPDVGKLIAKHGLVVPVLHITTLSEEFCKEFYWRHVKASYFGELVEHMTSASSIIMIFEGAGAVRIVREGFLEIRSGYGKTGKDTKSIVHSADSQTHAKEETGIIYKFFPDLFSGKTEFVKEFLLKKTIKFNGT